MQEPSTSAFILNRTLAFGDGINLTNIIDDRTLPGSALPAAVNSYGYPGSTNKLASIAQGATTARLFTYDGAGTSPPTRAGARPTITRTTTAGGRGPVASV